MLKTLAKTLEYLSRKYQLSIMIKDFTYIVFRTPPLSSLRNSFYIHNNEYCALIKSNKEAFAHCVRVSHSELKKKIQESSDPTLSFWGTCYGGVRDYVIPLFYDSFVIGAMIIGSFPCEAERAESSFCRLEREFGYDAESLRSTYGATLKEWKHDEEILTYEFKTCALYLQELVKKYVSSEQLAPYLRQFTLKSKRLEILDQSVEYIKSNLGNELSIQEIATACYCSKSTISHLFSEMLGMGVANYITNERVFYAQKLLRETSLPVAEISSMCGFCSPTYFANVFRQHTNLTALMYRKKFLKKK